VECDPSLVDKQVVPQVQERESRQGSPLLPEDTTHAKSTTDRREAPAARSAGNPAHAADGQRDPDDARDGRDDPGLDPARI
jgi:hypothetical protein